MNRIPDPHWIRPGSRLRIPLEWTGQNIVPAKVRAVAGKAYLSRSRGSAEHLQLGDRIQTTFSAGTTIEFADGGLLTVTEDSELRLDHLSACDDTGMVDTGLRLLKGRVESRVVTANGPGSRFEIKTPSAISAVRGTEYRMAVKQQDQSSNVGGHGGPCTRGWCQDRGEYFVAPGIRHGRRRERSTAGTQSTTAGSGSG